MMGCLDRTDLVKPAQVVVDLRAVAQNVRTIRTDVGESVRIMCAVKADAYGHGAVEVSQTVLSAGADMLGVASIQEALDIRDAGIVAPLLILGCSSADAVPYIVEYNIASTVCDVEFADALSSEAVKAGREAVVHVKVDTGMGRLGVLPDDLVDIIENLNKLPNLRIEGIFTHFPCADEPGSEFAARQIEEFRRLLSLLERRSIRPPIAHASNTGAILHFPDAAFDMVRPGIAIYGLYPSPEASRRLALVPALTFKSRIVFIKEVPAGTPISYGRTFITKKTTKVAVISVGYGDGYNRLHSNKGWAAVRDRLVPVIGRVCMDQTMLDVTDIPDVKVGDEVILYGGGHERLSVENIAQELGTIPYEVVCSIGKRVHRSYIPAE